MATVAASTAGSTTGSARMAEQHSAVRDQALTGFPMQRYIALVTNTLQGSNVGTLAPTVLTSSTLREMDVTEINDLLMITESITTVRANCEEQKNTAVSTEWLPTIPTPQSPINCFSLSALHARRTGNWRALKMAETLFPNCKLPHCSYTHTEYDCYTKVSMETVEILVFWRCCDNCADCSNCLLCMFTDHCSRDHVHWHYSTWTVCESTAELLVHSKKCTVETMSNALVWNCY